MRNTLIALVSGAGLLFSAAAMAGEPAKPTETADTVVCHHIVHEGMLLKTSQCHTQQYWDRERERQQQELRQWQLNSDMQR